MENQIRVVDVDFDKVGKLNQFAREMTKFFDKAFDMINTGDVKKYDREEAEFYLDQLLTVTECVPASEEFMKNVKKVFKDKQANFTIQNFLTWHHIDATLIGYFRNPERFEKFKSCAVTEIDAIFVDAMEKLIEETDLSVDQLRYAYFIYTIPKLLKYYYFFNKTEEEIEEDYETIRATRSGMSKLDLNSLYALQLITYNVNPMLHIVLQDRIAKRKSIYDALPTKINKGRYGNILYKGLTGQYKDLEKGDVEVRDIKSLGDIADYFEDRINAYRIIESVEGAKLKGAYINNVLVGVIAYTDRGIVNIHIDGDYRRKGISKKLLESVLKEYSVLGITPIGDSLEYVKRISKYDASRNQGVVTVDTLKGDYVKRELPNDFRIEDYEGDVTNLISDKFKNYFYEQYDVSEIQTKVAVSDNKIIGYISYDRKNKKIALIEVNEECSGMGVGSKLLESVINYNIWKADIAQSGVLFWFGKGISHEGSVYLCTSKKRLNKFAKSENIKNEVIPRMYLL